MVFESRAQNEAAGYTERDWINYAKAQGNSYIFNFESLRKIIGHKHNHLFMDSMARISIFEPLFYEGKEIRKTNLKAPVLTGRVEYFYLTGQLATQMDFENGMRDGKHRIYHLNKQLAEITNYKEGEVVLRDTVKKFSVVGKLISEEFGNDSMRIVRYYSYREGKLWYEEINRSFGSPNVSTYKNYDEESKEEKELNYDSKRYEQNCYDLKGKKVSFMKWLSIVAKEQREMEASGLVEQQKDTLQVSDEYLWRKFHRKRKSEFKRFKSGLSLSKIYSSCMNRKHLVFVDSTKHSNYTYNIDFPNTSLIDTLYCEPGKQIVRTAQTIEGKLNGKLQYFYPTGQKWAEFNFKDDYQDGAWVVYELDGKVQSKGKKSLGVPIDSTLEYSKSGTLAKLITYKDTLDYETKFFWEDGKTIQRMEMVKGSINALRVYSPGNKNVDSVLNLEKRYFNREGEELTKKQFEKDYPEVLGGGDHGKVPFRIKFEP